MPHEERNSLAILLGDYVLLHSAGAKLQPCGGDLRRYPSKAGAHVQKLKCLTVTNDFTSILATSQVMHVWASPPSPVAPTVPRRACAAKQEKRRQAGRGPTKCGRSGTRTSGVSDFGPNIGSLCVDHHFVRHSHTCKIVSRPPVEEPASHQVQI
jgi:hypothetical protein